MTEEFIKAFRDYLKERDRNIKELLAEKYREEGKI